MASYGHCGQCAARIQPQLPASDLVPFFQRRPGSYCARLAHVWSGWPGQVLAKCLWSRSQGAKIIRPGFGKMQPAHYLFPTFPLCCFLPHMSLITLCKVSLDQIWFWLTVSGFSQTDLVQRLGPTLMNQSGSDVNQIQHVYWGMVYMCCTNEYSHQYLNGSAVCAYVLFLF